MNYSKQLYLIHIIFGIILTYIGYKKEISINVYKGLLMLGILVLLYHSYLLVKKINNKIYSSYNMVNLLHILIVAPLLIYIGYLQNEANVYSLDFLFILGAGMSIHFISKLSK